MLIGATANMVAHHNGYTLRLLPGNLDIPFVATASALAAARGTWVIAVLQRQRTQVTQFALPVGIVVVLLLLSRLLPYPSIPDGWLGPQMGIDAEPPTARLLVERRWENPLALGESGPRRPYSGSGDCTRLAFGSER